MAIKIERVGTAKDKLGEGPLWDAGELALYWIDSISRVVHRLDPATGEVNHWGVPAVIGSMALRKDGGAVVALQTGLHFLDLATGECELVIDPEADQPRTRFNDGKVDRQGRFVAGTMVARDPRDDLLGSLYRLNADHSLDKLDTGILISNGPCFSPDGGTLYFTDSRTGIIYAYDYDQEFGATANRRDFIRVAELTGSASDGATVDSDGNLWVALVRNSQIGKFSPNGDLLETIDMPCALPSSVMFGGPDLDDLYVTSISDSLNRQSHGKLDGALLKITGLGATGIAEPRFAG